MSLKKVKPKVIKVVYNVDTRKLERALKIAKEIDEIMKRLAKWVKQIS